jgi:SHS2 domain-containing protein
LALSVLDSPRYHAIMFETFDHTADLGLRVRTQTLNQLFVEAAEVLFSTVVEDLKTVKPESSVEVRITSDDLPYLLFDWLRELLFRFEGEHLLFGRFEVEVSECSLMGTAWGEPVDRSRHTLSHEVKAITYHGLRVEQTADGWLAEVIVDI